MSDPKTLLARIANLRRLHYLPALVALVAMATIIVFVDWQMRDAAERGLRQGVTEKLLRIRTALDANIIGNVKLVQGYVAAVETEPGMDQVRYAQLGARIIRGDGSIRNVAAAPGLVVSMVYPMAGNERVLGLDYTKNPAQMAAALKVRDTRQMQLTGPVRLVQGGEGVIARFPVITAGSDGQERFWGLVSAVFDLERLYVASGLRSERLDIDVAITLLRDGKTDPQPFFGRASLLDEDPVAMTLRLGQEEWQLSAVPKDGWAQGSLRIWALRILMVLAALVVVLPMVWTGRLTEERERHLEILREREDALEVLSQRLEIALETSKIGVWDFDIVSGELIWDERMRDLYDVAVPDGRVGYADWKRALHPEDLSRSELEFARAIETERQYQTDFRVVRRDGEVRHIRAIGTTYRDSSGRKKIIGVNWDVTEDIRLQDDLRRAKQVADLQNSQLEEARLVMESAALHDALTGLPNRRYLDRIVEEYSKRPAEQTALTVMHIDLDRFKDINDTLGHAAGDRILRHAARALADLLQPGDFLARIGGDEFVVISAPENAAGNYVDLAGQMIEAIYQPVFYEGHECRVGSSIGIATRGSADTRIEEVLVNADIALYEAKRRGRNRVECFNEALRFEVVNTKRTADEILRGLEQNEFMAYFQPQFDARTLEIVGLEALARWDHPSKGILAPAAFLRIAESLKVVSQIDAVVLNQALLQQFRLNASGYPVPKVSVNVSAQRLRDETLYERLKSLSFRPGSLSFELLESISFDGEDRELIHQIERLKALGADIEIDDFGSGHASIVTLLKLTPRRLKIDRQLVTPILESKAQQQLVASIIEIGRARGIEIVAEGVETAAHVAVLRELGCDILQGYALARPMAPAELLGFVSERRWMDGLEPLARRA